MLEYCWPERGNEDAFMLVHCCSAEQPQLSYLPPSRVNSNPPVVPVLGGS